MKAFILLADSVRAHPDGTVSLLRGGLNQVKVPSGQQIIFRGSFLARVEDLPSEQETHEIRVLVRTPTGDDLSPPTSAEFESGSSRTSVQMCVDFALKLPGFGRYTFTVYVDDRELNSTWIDVKEGASSDE